VSEVWHFPPLRSLTRSEVPEFLAEHPFSVIHVDAAWDGYAASVAEKLRRCSEEVLDVGFATIDCDAEQQYAGEIQFYFRGTELIAKVIGITQDVATNIQKLKTGESIDESNRWSRG
jgi:hypothetical protein